MLKHALKSVSTNETMGQYRPIFFDLAEYELEAVIFSTEFYSQEKDLAYQIASQDNSFIYLREDKVRMIKVIRKGKQIPFNDFLSSLGIEIKSENLFKTGKYLSRVFRPVKYGGHFEQLDIHEVDAMPKGMTDGISLISQRFAKALGWNASNRESGQFTLFYNNGLVKGHCVVSDRIKHDIVIYKGNIKDEIKYRFNNLAYVTVEPVKLGKNLRLDIQTMLNIWEGFGSEMFFDWTVVGVTKFVDDLKAGKVTEWLDDFDQYVSEEEIDEETWKLKKAILRGVDYRRYPGLVRSAWSMFKNSLVRFAEDKEGNPIFRIPILGGLRGYIRPDLRSHDENGIFVPAEDKITIDRFGNVWIGGDAKKVERILKILGGADFDDSVGIIPLKDKKALLFRNPNQKGEYIIEDVVFEGIDIKKVYTLKGVIEQKKIRPPKKEKKQRVDNELIEKYMQKFLPELKTGYTLVNLIRTYSKISNNGASIGNVANAEMIRSSIGITNKKLMKELIKKYDWNLENVIDSTVKEGISCKEDLDFVDAFYREIVDNKIPIPKALIQRVPQKYHDKIAEAKDHPLDKLFEAMKYVIEDIDVKILGKGVVGRDRVKGWIDTIEVPIVELINYNPNNPMREVAIELLKGYNSKVAQLMEKKQSVFDDVSEPLRAIQTEFLKSLSRFSDEERKALMHVWAVEIYKTERFVHDSILWISDKEGLRGTADDMIDMLADAGLALQVKKNGTLKRYLEVKQTSLPIKSIRLWSSKELNVDEFKNVNSVMIVGRQALLGDTELNIADECEIKEGIYNIKEVTHAFSRKNNARLKNSLTIIVELQ